jgi:hypothetical protein
MEQAKAWPRKAVAMAPTSAWRTPQSFFCQILLARGAGIMIRLLSANKNLFLAGHFGTFWDISAPSALPRAHSAAETYDPVGKVQAKGRGELQGERNAGARSLLGFILVTWLCPV